jgi:hypothetical protein
VLRVPGVRGGATLGRPLALDVQRPPQGIGEAVVRPVAGRGLGGPDEAAGAH